MPALSISPSTPQEALACFLRTQMDVLVMGPFFLLKCENAGFGAGKSALAEASAAGDSLPEVRIRL